MRKPVVSVILPTIRSTFFKEAIDSILNQTFQGFEIIVIVEPGNSPPIPSDPRIQVIRSKKHLGIAGGRNLGLKLANGKYVVFHDDDDVSLPERFSVQVDYLNRHPSIAGLGSYWQEIEYDGRDHELHDEVPLEPAAIEEQMHVGCCLGSGTMMIRRSVFNSLGVFNGHYLFAEDYEYWFRAMSRGFKFANLPLVLYRYRRYPQAASWRYWQLQTGTNARVRVKYDNEWYARKCQEAKGNIQKFRVDEAFNPRSYLFHLRVKERLRQWHLLRVARWCWHIIHWES